MSPDAPHVVSLPPPKEAVPGLGADQRKDVP